MKQTRPTLFFIVLYLSSLLFCNQLLSRDGMQAYRIENAAPDILQMIEREGGRVVNFNADRSALVYLPVEMARRLDNMQVTLIRQPVRKTTADTLSSDLRIGYSYHAYPAVLGILDSLAALYPQLMRVETIGQTEEGRNIQAVCLGDNVHESQAEPEVCLIGAMHGNEILTQELLLCFIDSLLQNYGSDERITRLLDSTRVWILPNMNFDGSQALSRFNANGIDLNRDFPDREFDTDSDTSGRAAETKAVMRWQEQHNFILAANFHTGALLVNYPWDKNLSGESGYAATPDDDVFIRLSLAYARNNPMIYRNPQFENGITNGVLWYEVDGSMQDWAYHWHNTLEVTIEVAESLMPPADSIRYYYGQNGPAMLHYLEQVHSGVRGLITDAASGQPVTARIEVSGRDKIIRNNPVHGDYYRLLEPGLYHIRVSAVGYESREYKDVAVDSGGATQLNIALQPRTYRLLTGTVLDSLLNTPLDNVYLSAWQNHRLIDQDTTVQDGAFTLRLENGRYEIMLEKDGYFSRSDSLFVQTDLKQDFRLLKVIPSILAGKVFLSDGEAAEGTVVYCQSRTDTLGEDGVFRLDSLQGGTVHLFAWQQKYETARLDTLLGNGDSLWVTITLYPGDNEFYADFEENDGGFLPQGEWEWGEAQSGPVKAFNGVYLWGTNLSGSYASGAHVAVLESPVLFLQGMVLPQIEFYHWYDLEEKYDGGNLKISTDMGKTWSLLHPSPDYPLAALSRQYGNPLGGQPAYSGQSGGWQRVKVDLTPFKTCASLLFRFEMGVDEQKEASGWYIDRFHLYDANATGGLTQKESGKEQGPVLTVAPNPANPGTEVTFYLKQPAEVDLSVHNVRGQTVGTIFRGKKEAGWHRILWNGRDERGMPLASGMYFIRLMIKNRQWVHKFVLLR